MKIENVPQDNLCLGETTIRDLYYALDGNGDFRPVASVGWNVQNEALSLTWEAISEDAETVRRQVCEGKKSPLAWHMETRLFNVGLLASYTGISRKNVRKHLLPDHFARLSDATLKIYADVLNLTVDELKKV
jgi:hypothetical protein